MWLIICLIIAGALLIVAEFLLFPGTTIAGLMALGAFGWAVFETHALYTERAVWIVGAIILVVAVASTLISIKMMKWKKLHLDTELEGVSQEKADDKLQLGSHGVALTRLAPIGKAVFNGEVYEAKSISDYIDEKSKVEIVGFENFSVLVSLVKE